jgi:HAD superfamily hydrolase (TIGR01509 family)
VTAKGVRTCTLYNASLLIHENCGIGESVDEVFDVVDKELADYYKNTVELKPGAREFLDHLYNMGVKMCVATATAPHLLSILMEKFGLDKYFAKFVSCNDVGKGKEHPDVFIAAHEYLGTAKEATWIFEDSVVAIETAVRAGYNTVGVYDQFNFGIDKVKEISSVYIGNGDSLSDLIKRI